MLSFELTKDTPYLALSGELWSVFYEYFNRNWPCYKGFLLYYLGQGLNLWAHSLICRLRGFAALLLLLFLRWWPPSAMWTGPVIFLWPPPGCLNNAIFSNLGLCVACWARFMCYHELWPASVSHPFSSLNRSLGFARGKHYQKITTPVLQNFAIPGCFPYIPFCRYLFSLLSSGWFVIIPPLNEVERGVYWNQVVCLSVCPSVHLWTQPHYHSPGYNSSLIRVKLDKGRTLGQDLGRVRSWEIWLVK